MADKRMFSRKILESDDFLSLSKNAQILYFYLCLNADDEGLLNNTRTVIGICGCEPDDLTELIRSGYILQILPSVYAVTHWNLHNSIQADRFHKSIIVDWKRYLDLEDKVYKLKTHWR